MQLQYRCIDYESTAAQRKVLHLKLKLILILLQYRIAVVGAQREIMTTATYCNAAGIDNEHSFTCYEFQDTVVRVNYVS